VEILDGMVKTIPFLFKKKKYNRKGTKEARKKYKRREEKYNRKGTKEANKKYKGREGNIYFGPSFLCGSTFFSIFRGLL
jgi:hypothetical protein